MSRSLAIRIRYALRHSRLAQIGLIVCIWLVGEAVVRLARIPIPGSIIGMGLALLLLASGWISLFSLRRGAEWFLAEMLLFFIPAVLAVTDHPEFLGSLGAKVLVVIFLGTICVMVVTALTVELCIRWRARNDRG